MSKSKKPVKGAQDDEFDAILASFQAETKGNSKNKGPSDGQSGSVAGDGTGGTEGPNDLKKEDNEDDCCNEELGEGGKLEEEGGGPGAKTLKNRLRKQKMKMKQEQKKATGSETVEAEESKKEVKKNKGPMSAAAKLALERLRLVEQASREEKEAEERERREEEERSRKEAEDAQRAEEEKEKRRLARQERREQARREGKLLTAKEREARERNQAYLEKLQAEGLLLHKPGEGPAGQQRSRKIIEDRRKNKKKVTSTVDTPVEPLEPETTQEIPEDEAKKEDSPVEDWEELSESSDGGRAKKGPKPPKSSKHIVPPTVKPVVPRPVASETGSTASGKSSNTSNDISNNNSDCSAGKSISTTKSPPKPSETTTDVFAEPARLRSPICCILGHVDTGKTKLLDRLRHTNVQDNEAGGITQQIGATFAPKDRLIGQCHKVDANMVMEVPGLLIIDTPGHESFNNLRSRGSSLCDIAILVIDIMHGLEPQTRESIGLLKARKCPFVIALNKIDRLYGWKEAVWGSSRASIGQQAQSVRDEFEKRATQILGELQVEGLNSALYWENDDLRKTVSIAPTSAITGEGIPDLLYLLISLTQDLMTKNITIVDANVLSCTILEVKAIEGLGVTIDIILANGFLREGDTIVVCGMSGPIVTTIRALLTPQPMRELRVKTSEYIHHKVIYASMGVKISAQGLDDAVCGTQVLRVEEGDDVEQLKEDVMVEMSNIIFGSIDKSGTGVYVMASTLGSLEALLQFLKTSNIKVFGVNIGTVHKMDVKKASVMREKGHPEYAVILAFDIRVDPEAEKEAVHLGVKIMTADIIYHLFDQFTKYIHDFKQEQKKEVAGEAVFPCMLSVMPQYIFNKKDPIVLGVKVEAGILKVNTPLSVPDKQFLRLGRVASLEHNKKVVEKATKGMEVAVKIVGEPQVTFGRQFDHTNKIYSRITRDSIDCLKAHFRDELSKDDWRLVMDIKKIYDII